MNNKKISQNVLWNTVGSLFYLGCQWLLSIAVVALSSGYDEAGILSLAMSLSNVFAMIALFNVRNYQVSDIDAKYTSSDYASHRIFTCLLSILLCAGFSLINGYSPYVLACIIGFSSFRLIEAFADVLHGMAQKKWRLDISGKSSILRGALLLISFCIVEWKTKNLALAILAMVISNLLSLIIYDVRAVLRVEKFKFIFDRKKLTSLSIECLPLLIYGVLINANSTVSRYFMEMFHGEEVLGYYATVSSIAVLVQAFVTLIFTPFAGMFASYHAESNKRSAAKLLLKLVLMLTAVTSAALIAVFVVEKFAMSRIFCEEILPLLPEKILILLPYVYLLYPTVIISCLTAFAGLLGMILVVIRDKKTLIFGASAGFAVTLLLSLILIPENAYLGANIAVISAFSLAVIIYLVRCLVYLFRKSALNERNSNND